MGFGVGVDTGLVVASVMSAVSSAGSIDDVEWATAAFSQRQQLQAVKRMGRYGTSERAY
jgi:hypothetical protein